MSTPDVKRRRTDASEAPGSTALLFDLTGRVALVTGGATGIGYALAKGLLDAGAKVAIGSRTLEKVKSSVEKLSEGRPGRVLGVALDVRDDASAADAVAKTVAEFGALHILVNSAGVMCAKPALELKAEDMNAAYDTNATGSFRCAQAATRQFIKQGKGEAGEAGCILNIGSITCYRGPVNVLAYSMTKGAVHQLTQGLSNEFAEHGVRCNAIAPGFTLTDFNRHLIWGTDRGRRILEATPAGRFGTADEMAGACVYLCSPAARFTTGITLPVDGGFLAGGITRSNADWDSALKK
eukprot:Hpha_TRINITY_DN15130_c1_g1::TRINITY_DN15130_c1_g1_i4::g.129254::m.129254/K00065/kduD; 2-dehydro-3-deoxy-D-gluconate 5-dehydrogenase